MIAVAKESPRVFDEILLWKLSCVTRHSEHASFCWNLLRKRGVTVTSLHERVDDTAQGRLMEGFIEVMGGWRRGVGSASWRRSCRLGGTRLLGASQDKGNTLGDTLGDSSAKSQGLGEPLYSVARPR